VQGNSDTIGGTSAGAGNLISGNVLDGILLDSSVVGNQIQGNRIGTDATGLNALGNGGAGVDIKQASNTLIGGTAAGAANTIAFNTHQGVFVQVGNHNRITGNSIFSNGGLGIDLDPSGVPAGNDQQPAPVVSTLVMVNNDVTIGGSITAGANAAYDLEFFANTSLSAAGEGRVYLGTASVTTDATGTATFSTQFPVPAAGIRSVTATATATNGDTSEFSASLPLSANVRFVEALYVDFLHRTGDFSNPKDAGAWVTLLDNGTPAATVANLIARSGEALGVDVDGLYQRFLGRASDPTGRAVFVAYLQAGGTLEGVSAAMLASAEYQSHFATDSSFVQSLYHNVLNRTGSNAEIGAWLAVLPQLGRPGVAQDFLLSQEYRAGEVGNDYTQLLHRTPSTAEVNFWAGSGLDLLTIDTLFAASPEFYQNS
jgi:parallel beta-helix repeat protein